MRNADPRATVPTARDALLIYAAGFIRSAAVSLVGVTLAIHLADVGFSTTQIGLLIGVGLAGSSLATVLVSARGDLWGTTALIIAPASPSAALAAALFLAREALFEMDVPTRQSYVMAVVKPAERTFASGVTNVTRNVAWAVGPPFAGMVVQHVALAGPLIIGGMLKIA
jgi:MFS family permease